MKLGRIGWLSLGALWTGCGGYSLPEPQVIQEQAALVSFDDCAGLEKYLKDSAVLDMRARLEASKQWYGGPLSYEDGSASDSSASGGASGPSAYTTTNVQTAGVDEADFVKNDGTRIFVLTGKTLYLNQSWPAAQLGTLAKVELEGWPREMYLDDSNHVIVFSSIYTPLPGSTTSSGGGGAAADLCAPGFCGNTASTLKLTVVDVSTLAQPRVVSELYQPGDYVSSRRVGSSVRLVTSDSFHWPDGTRWYPDLTQDLYNDKVAKNRAFDALGDKNEQLIRAQPVEAWLPKSSYKQADGTLAQVGYSCSEFSHGNAPTRLGVVSVSTLDLSPETLAATGRPAVKRVSIVGEGSQVYSSATRLYVANQHWWWETRPGQEDYTYLHAFDLGDPAGPRYVASGGVKGHILDQFSMDEKDGNLRVATTLSRQVADARYAWGRTELSNRISVLAPRGGKLQVVGESEELAPGEHLYSSRFLGDRAYVVTFRTVDPFYTFDLSDPTHPRKVGELKVPGFSSYLHPVDDTHVMSIGVYVPENNTDWRARALKLSLYDVSDFAHPRETFTKLVGNYAGYSEALWDHKAFNYFPERKLLAIPFSDWSNVGGDYWSGFVSDLRVFSVDPATGFTARGALSMRDVYQHVNYYSWSWYWTPIIRRSVMADDYVYAISDGGIRVAKVSALDQPVATVLFSPYIGAY